MSKKKLNNKNSNNNTKVFRSTLLKSIYPQEPVYQTIKYNLDSSFGNISFIKTFFPVDRISNKSSNNFYYFTSDSNIFYDKMDTYGAGEGSNKKYYCPSDILYIEGKKPLIYNYTNDNNISKNVSIPSNSLVISINQRDQMCQDNDNGYKTYTMSNNMLTIHGNICKSLTCKTLNDTIQAVYYDDLDDLVEKYRSNIKNVVFISDGKIDPVYAPDNF